MFSRYAIIVLTIVFAANFSNAKERQEFNSEHFELNIPSNWTKVFIGIRQEKQEADRGVGQISEDSDFLAKYQISSGKLKGNGYLKIYVDRTSRVKESQISSIAENRRKVFKILNSSESLEIKKLLSNPDQSSMYFESGISRLFTKYEFTSGGMRWEGLLFIRLTSYGQIFLFFASRKGDWSNILPEFLSIAGSMTIQDGYSYIQSQTSADKRTDNMRSSGNSPFSFLYDVLYPFVNFILSILPILALTILFCRTKPGHKLMESFSEYKFTFALVICFLSLLIQIAIASYTIVPVILSLGFVYPLGILIERAKGSELCKSQFINSEKLSRNNTAGLSSDSSPKSDGNGIKSESSQIPVMPEPTYEHVCRHCHKTIILDDTEYANGKYNCSECGSENLVNQSNVFVQQGNITQTRESAMSQLFTGRGRICRSTFLVSLIVFYFVTFVFGKLPISEHRIAAIFYLIILIAGYWFIFAQGARRCHDLGKNGWYQIIPFYGLWMLFQDSEIGPNEYGADPREGKRF